ncbi:hypothetical protein [Rhizobium sp. OAE497]|jgi:hypothetical protein|uniref:hypothetical protein n=1 Tax=Rhizobium sp. OAE497 TaxID=2663796 RepID=UPI000DDAFDEB
MKKITSSILAAVIGASCLIAVTDNAAADDWRHRRHYDRHYHDNTGAAIAGGLAAGVIGGMIGGALVNNGPRYVEPPPPPPPRCWFEDRQVANAYDGGWHMESVRVCR